ncbi:MAG: hypothetical protein LBC75_11470 [Fibromonadaceae bacterium]|jgi:hypothetical protein|nr:hypothetical protein [Fibromonadaceae bacterium]
MATKKLEDFLNPDSSLFSEDALNNFRNKKDERIRNSAARKNHEQSFWNALNEDAENFKNYKSGDRTITEVFKELLG